MWGCLPDPFPKHNKDSNSNLYFNSPNKHYFHNRHCKEWSRVKKNPFKFKNALDAFHRREGRKGGEGRGGNVGGGGLGWGC